MPNSISQAHRRVVRTVALPIMTLVALMICAVIAMVVFLAHRQTEDALERQRELARGMIDVRLGELVKIVNDYAHWNEALNQLVLHPDMTWADTNIGPNMERRFGIDTTFVITPDGRTTYGMTNGVRTILPADRVMSSGFDRILEERRRKGPDASGAGLALAKGQPALVAVAALKPFDSPAEAMVGQRSVLAFVDLLDDRQLKELSDIYRLPGLHVESGEDASPASVVVLTSDGRVPVRLAWTGDDPGGRLLSKLLPTLLTLLAVFGGLIFILLRQGTLLLRNLRRAEEQAARDALTGLLNRSVLMRDLDSIAKPDRERRPCALLYLDLDGFKAVNDTFGHGFGDLVLKEVAARLRAVLPDGASAYRLGGDEFSVLLMNAADRTAIRGLGAQIIVALSTPYRLPHASARIGVTVGVALAPDDGDSPADIIRRADEALYAGKRGGKGTVAFYADIGTPGDGVARAGEDAALSAQTEPRPLPEGSFPPGGRRAASRD